MSKISYLARGRAALRARLKRLVLANILGFLPRSLKVSLIAHSGLLDWTWYKDRWFPQAQDAKAVARHFIYEGAAAGYECGPLFDSIWYRHQYGLRASNVDCALHYLLIGDLVGLKPSPWFDPRHFRRINGGKRSIRPSLADYYRGWRDFPSGHPLFDTAWYLHSYPDVAAAGSNPLAHYATCGIWEGRRPNPYFVPEWYLSRYPDVGRAKLNPARHFFAFGASEGRSPGPEFDAGVYSLNNPDQANSGLDPLAHYLAIGRSEHRSVGRRAFHLDDLVPADRPPDQSAEQRSGVIDVIVPVYRGLAETRNCLKSVLASNGRQAIRLRVYNDKSPEPEVTAYLRAFAAENPSVLLIENESNLGFVGTVNAGMRAALSHEDSVAVLLLNSDTIVSPGWVDRMFGHISGRLDVGTVCAMSNNATICSFPKLGPNAMAAGFSPGDVDALAAVVNRGRSVDIPTAVGFCMLIGRDCLVQTGLFDEEAFGKGYGEENDFCMRASGKGFRHLLALDVFVEHVGEVSFAEVSKPGKLIAEKIIAARYPDYGLKVMQFVAADPSQSARLRLVFALWKKAGKPLSVLITHGWGGGTERFVGDMDRVIRETGPSVILRPVSGTGNRIQIENRNDFDGFDVTVELKDGEEFAQLLNAMGAKNVQIHHLVEHPEFIRDGLARAGLAYDFYVHDYFTVCPQITLTDVFGRYCGEPAKNVCDMCIAQRPSNQATDIRNWRIANEWAVLGADRVIAPSEDAANRIERYFGVRPEVRYHEKQILPIQVVVRESDGRPLKVAILGFLAQHKGLDLVVDAANAAELTKAPMRFQLIGEPHGALPKRLPETLQWSGAYKEEDLPDLIAKYDPDVFLFASQAPETYSYTLTKAMATGRPIVATALGAFVERLAAYPAARLVRYDITGEELVRTMLEFVSGLSASQEVIE